MVCCLLTDSLIWPFTFIGDLFYTNLYTIYNLFQFNSCLFAFALPSSCLPQGEVAKTKQRFVKAIKKENVYLLNQFCIYKIFSPKDALPLFLSNKYGKGPSAKAKTPRPLLNVGMALFIHSKKD